MDVQPWMLILIVALPFIGTGGLILLHNRPDAREVVSARDRGPDIPALPPCDPIRIRGRRSLYAAALHPPGALPPVHCRCLRAPLPAGLASFLWIVTTVYSIGYMRGLREHAQTRYYACFAVCIGAVMGVCALNQPLLALRLL